MGGKEGAEGGRRAAVLEKYLRLRLGGETRKSQATYVWIDGSGEFLRAKSRTMEGLRSQPRPEDFPVWNYDGSSTGQAVTGNSDTYLKPVAVWRDPLRPAAQGDPENRLVLCETFNAALQPLASNHRHGMVEAMSLPEVRSQEPWFGMEQEYLILDEEGPLGWPRHGFPAPQGPYYCSVGAGRAMGRPLVEAHYKACLFAGIRLAGTNAEVCPAQWEFQVGPCEGVAMGDQLWMARFLLHRIGEEMGLRVSLHPKPVAGDWNGAGLHSNFSTRATRGGGGLAVLRRMCEEGLGPRHSEHLRLYDLGGTNRLRLSGLHETSSPERFSWGVADRQASVRIPRDVAIAGAGYLEDRRPASNADPYLISHALIASVFNLPLPGPPADLH